MAKQLDNRSTEDQPAPADFFLGLAEKTAKRPSPVPVTFVIANVIGIDFTFFTALTLLVLSTQHAAFALTLQSLSAGLGISGAIVLVFYGLKLYRIEAIANYALFLRRFVIVGLWAGVAATLWAAVCWEAFPHLLSIKSIFAVPAQAMACILGYRFLGYRFFKYCEVRGYVRYNVVLLGTAELAAEFEKNARHQGIGVRVVSIFPYEVNRAVEKERIEAANTAATAALLRFSKSNQIDAVVVVLPYLQAAEVALLEQQLSAQPLRVRLLPSPFRRAFRPFFVAAPGEVPGMNLTVLSDPPIRGRGRDAKRVFDVAAASLALLFFGPLMAICAIGVKLSSPGPVLFRQQRIGFQNVEFSVYKFRTMHQAACNLGTLTVRNDPRTFKFGQILRKLSLDELPQLFNVLLGDMSMVGPRPHMSEARAAGIIYHLAVAHYEARHRVKPGITGLAQVSGWRGPTETIEQIEKRVEHDLKYIQSWSLLLDLKILLKTALVGFVGKNAF